MQPNRSRKDLAEARRTAASSPSTTAEHEAQLTGAALDAIEAGVVVIDARRRLVRANGASGAILGVDLTSAIGTGEWWRPLRARRSGDSASLELDVAATVLRTGEAIRDVGVSVDRPDGASVSLAVDYVPLRTGPGPVTGVLLTFRDVTELSRLQVAERRLREAHEVARLTSWEWWPETDEIVLFVPRPNDTEELEGGVGTLEELLAQMPVEQGVNARENLAGFVRGDYDESVRLHPDVLGGRETWLETRSRAVRAADGHLLSVRGTTQDVTAQELSRGELIATRDFFQATLDSFPAQVAVLDQAGELLTTNRAWKEFAAENGGHEPATTTNYFAACDAAGDDQFALRAAVGLRAVAVGERDQFTLEYPCSSAEEERWFLLRGSRYEGPGSARMVVAHYEVTERRIAERQVLEQASLLEEVDVAVIATDLERHVTQWNPKAEELYGWNRCEALGRHVDELVVRPGGNPLPAQQALAEDGRWENVFSVVSRGGRTFPVEVRVRAMIDASGTPFGLVGTSSDITGRVASERALVEARDYMRAVADSMGQGLLTLDVDGRVSYVNAAAEALLSWTPDQLRGRSMADLTVAAPRDDESVERGDPFERAWRDGVEMRVEDAAFLRGDGAELPVACTAAPFETSTGVQGCVVLFEDISERKAYEAALLQDVEKLTWIDRIQQALADDRFVLHAQPIIDLQTREVVQRELLLRMSEPDGSIVGPGTFLPIAEKYGLIGDIDRWVIEQAAAAAATGCPVEINVSARSVGDPTIVEHIERCLRDSGADPSLVVFEITETALVEDEAAALAFAERIHALGSKLALDDFGTGYGTFTYLKHLPVDYLKIDIEFVRDLASNRASHHVVQAVVALAQAFGLQTVAEGVEDGETLELLGALGVDLAQGYHIARPAPMEAGDAGLGSGAT